MLALETRTCVCGCGLSFRVLPTSKQTFRSETCKAKMLGAEDSLKQGKKAYKVPPKPHMVSATRISRMLDIAPNTFDYWVKKLNIPFERNGTQDRWFDPKMVKKLWDNRKNRESSF